MDTLVKLLLLAYLVLPVQADITLANPSDPVTEYLTCGTGLSNDLFTGDGVTIWVRARITGVHATKTQQWFFSNRDGTSGGMNFYVNNANPTLNDQMQSNVDAASTDASHASAAQSWPDDSAWRTGAMSWDGAALEGSGWKFSLNGATVAVSAVANGGGAIVTDAGHITYVGSSNSQSQTFNGSLAGLLVCATELSQATMNAMTNETRLRRVMQFCPTADTLLALDFLEGTPGETESDQTQIIDHSPAGNHCTLNNGTWAARTTE